MSPSDRQDSASTSQDSTSLLYASGRDCTVLSVKKRATVLYCSFRRMDVTLVHAAVTTC
jgi:hypothetical protein